MQTAPQPTSRLHHFAAPGGARAVPAESVFSALGVSGLIRMQRWESDLVAQLNEFWHFNLGKTPHRAGEPYGLVTILRAGRREPGGVEEPPLLQPDNIRIAKAMRVEHVSSLKDVPEEWLRPSTLPLPAPSGLAAALSAKYAKDDEGLREAILKQGVTATLLCIDRTVEEGVF